MVSDFISDKAPLFYYSFRQVRTTNDGKEEYHDASKVTIRKNNDYGNNGLQFSVFNVIRYGEHWQSDGINQTRIDRETFDRVDFYGKGEDSNRLGVFLYKKALPEIAFAFKGEKNILWYLNFYSDYNDDVFEISQSGIIEFIRSTSIALQGTPYNPLQNTMYAIRAFVLSHYSKIYNMNRYNFPGVSSEEWDKKETTIEIIDNVDLLSQMESLCDSRMHEALHEYQSGNAQMFNYRMEHMVDLIGTYYILYRTVL